jgi:hypothetical protein
MNNRLKLIRCLFLLFLVYFFISPSLAQNEKDPIISILGVYEYVYEYNTEDLIENHYIELFITNGKINGYYYGTSDDFDGAREGYLPGFFSAKIKNLNITASTISFEVEVKNTDFFNKPITPLRKIKNNSPWKIGIEYNKRKYHGEIKNRKIIIHTDNFDTRVFTKIKN